MIQHIKRLDIRVQVLRSAPVTGLGYGLCDPGLENVHFIAAIDEWLACASQLESMSLLVQSNVGFVGGSRLGTKWEWLLPQLDSLKQKYAQLKFIAFKDEVCGGNGQGVYWAYKDSTTKVWSGLKWVGSHGVSVGEIDSDLKRAGVDVCW